MRTVHQYDEENGRNLFGRVSPDLLSYDDVHETLAVALDGQTVFSLAFSPLFPHLSELVLNGVRARYGVDYVIDGLRLEWISSMYLETNDSFTIDYTREK